MSQGKNNNGIGHIVKSLIVTMLKLIAIGISFIARIIGFIFIGISDLFSKLSGNGTTH